jgi:hypothetical protein
MAAMSANGENRQAALEHTFYQLCVSIEPAYHQLEFDPPLYLTQVGRFGKLAWPPSQKPAISCNPLTFVE